MTFTYVGEKLLNTITVFVICMILSMLVRYIAQIRGKLNKLIIENTNLLDQMHEGLIVISEKERNLRFASKPAMHLFSRKSKINKNQK